MEGTRNCLDCGKTLGSVGAVLAHKCSDPTPAEVETLTKLSQQGWSFVLDQLGWCGRNNLGHGVGPYKTAKQLLAEVEKEQRWVQ